MERKRTERKRKSEEKEAAEGKEATGNQFVGGRKEKRERKKDEEEENKRKGTRPASCSGRTRTGSEWNCTTRGRCLSTSILFYAYGFLPRLYVVWFVCDCGKVMDQVYEFSRPTEHGVLKLSKSRQNGK